MFTKDQSFPLVITAYHGKNISVMLPSYNNDDANMIKWVFFLIFPSFCGFYAAFFILCIAM